MSDLSRLSLPRMTAWERWEMGAVQGSTSAGALPFGPAANAAAQARAGQLGEAAERISQRQAATQAGHAEGFAQGHAQGMAAGRAQGEAQGRALAQALAEAELVTLRASWLALASSLPRAWQAAEEAVAQDLLALALTLAQQVLGQSLAIEPTGLLAVVQGLLQAEPALSGHPKLLLHPDDAALVREHLADELHSAGWNLRPDPHMERGGCRVVAASGELDATLPTRWAQVAARLQHGTPAAPEAAFPVGLPQAQPAGAHA